MKFLYSFLVNSDGFFIDVLRIAICVVMCWIGGLKSVKYEAEGIVPFVANSPLMSFFYRHSAEYKKYMNKEGEVVPENIAWHKSNRIYIFAYCLGTVIVFIGILTLAGIWLPGISVLGGLLTFGMSLVTLSFLITTPETYVANRGGLYNGFPYLSGAGRLVIKDLIMMASGLVVAADCAKRIMSL